MPITPDKTNHIVKKIVKAIKPKSIYLFGSYADGTATVDSDLDLLIVADMAGTRRQRNIQVRRLFPHRDFSLDVFVLRPDEFDRQRHLLNSVSNIGAETGRLVYER